MHEENIIIKTIDGNLDCTVFLNKLDENPFIIFYMDAPAIREELRTMCRRIAKNGYNVVLPNLFALSQDYLSAYSHHEQCSQPMILLI